jgi:hypothetical protein
MTYLYLPSKREVFEGIVGYNRIILDPRS